MRWKAMLYLLSLEDNEEDLDDEIIDDEKRENYDFKTTTKPPPVKDIDFENFEKDLFKIPDPNKPCHLEIVKSRNNDTDHSGSRVIDTDVKSQLISTHFFNHQSCR